MKEIYGRKTGGCATARAARCTSPTCPRACWAPTASSAAARRCLRRGAGRQARGQRRRRRRLLRRRRLQPGHHARGHEPGRGVEPAGDLRLREQRLRRDHVQHLVGGRDNIADRAAGLRHARRRSSTASTSSPCTRRPARRSRGRAAAAARRCIECKITRYYGHFEGDAQTYRAQARSSSARPSSTA